MVATRSSDAAPARPRAEFFSHPSEEELIARHLLPRVSSPSSDAAQNNPSSFIHEADVYSRGPAELTNTFAPAVASNGDRAWYFLSAVRAKSREGQRKARTVDSGEGCWHSEAGAKPVVLEPGRRLGHRQSFSFVTKVDGRRVRSGWLMVELGLDGTDEMVLCKIYFSPRAHLLTGGPNSNPAPVSSSRKRKAIIPATVEHGADKKKNPAAPEFQKRYTYLYPEEGVVTLPPYAINDDSTHTAGGGEEAEQKDEDTQSSLGVGIGSWADYYGTTTGSLLSLVLDNSEELYGPGYVDRAEEQLCRDLGIQEFCGTVLDGAAEKRQELPPLLPPYDDNAANSGYPLCLTHEDLYSTEPLWFESFSRGGYSGVRNGNNRRRR
ncbi:hypothetical protein PR202_ga10157 [Eleusine coracana subsp. coracana]|uniref:NAC domain-containing protein n=1 Tax=Eleusine coracana subsp. coracana TaxID=191504 RepID=A0AAV5C610_ELECO|nr:hypothetical protein QOZ80_1AG0028400 [Eleusine coracana subsp. coracana]GJM93590.1 hypothetical protein PR202_ga10157 [Eleusine coracana subsp. coracana]